MIEHASDNLVSLGQTYVARALTAPPRAKPTWTTAMRKDAPARCGFDDTIRTLRAMNEVDAGIVEMLKAMDGGVTCIPCRQARASSDDDHLPHPRP